MSDTVAIAGITAMAGLGGAVIAAIAAGYRQKNELAHDRRMRDLSEIRKRLDDVMDQGEEALKEMNAANDALAAELLDRCEEDLRKAKEKLNQVHARVRRIRLLYGDDYDDEEDLVIPLQIYLSNLEAVSDLIATAHARSETVDDEELKSLVVKAAKSQVHVIAVASRQVGARIQS